MSIKTILAALALETENDPVAARAIQLARQHGARLIVLHVIEADALIHHDMTPPADQAAIHAFLRQVAQDHLQLLLKTAPADTEILIETGRPHELIDELTRAQGVDLIAIGAGKARNLREKMFGSTADRVVRTSPCPVLVVRTDTAGAYRRVVTGVDFSATSIAAARSAALLAPNATIELLHAVEIPPSFEQAMLKVGTSQAEIDRYRRARARAARKQLLAALPRKGGLPDGTRARVLHGPASAVLIRSANRGGTDLIALGTQGRNAVSRLVLGSVARKVLGAAACDILTVPVTGDSDSTPGM